ncbi:hypothetical protein CKO31_25790 [Thiohalocapsa halophila]|uniref:Uncharacterized protein n=1 Tax=Thiohalocapsa halophila TaxID=69359 RepID=A0ABS1CQ59_9GAMM|nr:hypothetical protein [Thiohalocapsa halophila]MBK1634066.1 hypothetical protein [Thiohalocapsa halophila]
MPNSPGVADALGLSETIRYELPHQASQLPQIIRFFDDCDEVERSIRAATSECRIRLNGSTSIFRVGLLETAHRDLLQHALAVVGLPSGPLGTRDALGHLLAYSTLLHRTAEAAVQGRARDPQLLCDRALRLP